MNNIEHSSYFYCKIYKLFLDIIYKYCIFWQKWKGAKVDYKINSLYVSGYRGRSVWYIPAYNKKIAKTMSIKKGQALKIIKFPMLTNPISEYYRLYNEFLIQKILFLNNMAANVYEIILVKNLISNKVLFFDELYEHPGGSVYFSLITEDLSIRGFKNDIFIDKEQYLHGMQIEQFKRKCNGLGIKHYDIGLGNIFVDKQDNLKVVDVHNWNWLNNKIQTKIIFEYLNLFFSF